MTQPQLFRGEPLPRPALWLLEAMDRGIARLTRREWAYCSFIELCLFRTSQGWAMGPWARLARQGDAGYDQVLAATLPQYGWLPWYCPRPAPWQEDAWFANQAENPLWVGQEGSINKPPEWHGGPGDDPDGPGSG
jgi:hypothetical protein